MNTRTTRGFVGGARVRRLATGALGCAAVVATITGLSALPAAAATDEAIQLSWDGHDYTATTTESFVGLPVVVPGDHAERTITVRNAGPGPGVLSVTIANVDLLDAADADTFYDDVSIEWEGGGATLAELDADEETGIAEIDLGRGETTTVTIGYDFPVDAVSGNSSQVGPRSASFDVQLLLGGDTQVEPAPHESAHAAPTQPDDRGPLAATGGAPAMWLALAGAVLIPLGLLARRVRRRERRPRG